MVIKKIKIFLPLLLLYTAIILTYSASDIFFDEVRYVGYAKNLLEGHYSPRDNISLINGPGYPIFLVPFIFLKVPWLIPKLMNGILLFAAVIYFFNSLRMYIDEKPAALFSIFLGLYPPILKTLPYLLTECIAFFLVCGFVYSFCKLHQNKYFSWKQLISAGLYLSALVLTRVFFGYVVSFMLILLSILNLLNKSTKLKKSFLVFLLSLFFCSPYLIYTYSLTGKVFYWSTNGGEVLYWMTTPYKNELGEWFGKKRIYGISDLAKNHKQFYDDLESLSDIEKDKRFKAEAIKNIKAYPKKYIVNWMANWGRLLFNYPYSYTPQKITSYFRFIPNMFIVVLSILSVYPFYLVHRLVPYEIKILLIIIIIYVCGSSLVSATSRYFEIIVPVIFMWISIFINKFIKINIKN